MINEHKREEAAKALRQLADNVESGEIEVVIFASSSRIENSNIDEMGVYNLSLDDDEVDSNRLIGLVMRLKRDLIKVYGS